MVYAASKIQRPSKHCASILSDRRDKVQQLVIYLRKNVLQALNQYLKLHGYLKLHRCYMYLNLHGDYFLILKCIWLVRISTVLATDY